MKYDLALHVRRPFFVAFGLLALTLTADASKPRLRLERIDATDFASDETIRVYASIVELEGSVDDDRAAPTFNLRMSGHSVGRPLKMTQFQGAGDALDLVLVVEASALYGPPKIIAPPPAPPPPKLPKGQKPPKEPKAKAGKAPPPMTNKGKKLDKAQLKQIAPGGEPLDKVKDALKDMLESMSPRFRVLLLDYGADLTAHLPFRAAQSVESDVDDLSPDGEAGDLTLSNAVKRALDELKKPRSDGKLARRLIVVVSDGLNSQMDRNTFKALGDRAAREHVPIHTIAFSPTDERGPLLNLGEISKRSNGTFRWAKSADDLHAQIETLSDELNKQYVLTYKIDARSLEGKKFQLTCEDLESNVLLYDSSGGSFGLAPATRPLIPWWLWLAFGLVALGAGGVFVARRFQRRPKNADEVLAVQSRRRTPQRRSATTGGATTARAGATPRRCAGSGASSAGGDARPLDRGVGRARRTAHRRRRAADQHRQGSAHAADQRRSDGVDAPRRARAQERRRSCSPISGRPTVPS